MKGKRLRRNTIVLPCCPDSLSLNKAHSPHPFVRPFRPFEREGEPFLRKYGLFCARRPSSLPLQSGGCGQHGGGWPLMALPFLPSFDFVFPAAALGILNKGCFLPSILALLFPLRSIGGATAAASLPSLATIPRYRPRDGRKASYAIGLNIR